MYYLKNKNIIKLFKKPFSTNILNSTRESDQLDVIIIGAGPSGLSASIRLKQLCLKKGVDLRIGIIEKGAEVGSHILSGAVLEPKSLNELFPDWKEKQAPLRVPVKEDKFYFLTEKNAIKLPTPKYMKNHGNYIISLGELCRWLAQEAQNLGIEIYTGIAGTEILYNQDGSIKGIATGDMGIGKDGKPKSNFARGMELHAKFTLFAEGCRGSLTKLLIEKFKLREGVDPQHYGLGVKELWEIKPENHQEGLTIHTIGWPVDLKTWGGSFMYHWDNNRISLGYVVGLDYQNPYLSPFKELQRWKHHPFIKKFLEGGRLIQYGARALNEGGFQSIPKLIFPGGALIGDTAGFLNVPKIKGNHTAIKSGILAAESLFEALTSSKNNENPILLSKYPERLKDSWLYDELYQVRNIHPSFQYGLIPGLIYSAIDTYIFMGHAPWTFHHKEPDHESLKKISEVKKIEYPKPDGKISFDLMTALTTSGTNHNEDQPPHLKLKDSSLPISYNLPMYDNPETRYCPAGVYEIIKLEDGNPKLQINAQNCLHCKTCDIKDPKQNIDYTPPEGGGGPAYISM